MLLKLQTLVHARMLKLTEVQQVELFEKSLIYLYGSEDAARNQLKQISESSKTPSEFEDAFNREFNVKFLSMLFTPLLTTNLSALIKGAKELEDSVERLAPHITNPTMLQSQLNEQLNIGQLVFKMIFDLADKPVTKETVVESIKNLIYFTKEEISNEFGVDKKTLGKWLDAVGMGEKYFGRKKLNILEYVEIFSALFLASSEQKLDLNKHFEYYFSRLNQMAYKKEDLVQLTGSDYKTLRENSEKSIPAYNELNIFPYHIAMAIMQKMGEEPIHIHDDFKSRRSLR